MTKARILIAEPDVGVTREIGTQLTRLGHDVVGVTRCGSGAVRIVPEERADLVLMNINLAGEFDAIEAARRIRNLFDVPVVFVLADADDHMTANAGMSQPFGYLIQPFSEVHLRTVVETALRMHASERKLRENERLLAATLCSIGDAVIAADVHALVSFMNPTAEAMTGWSRDEAIGRPLNEVLHVLKDGTRLTAATSIRTELLRIDSGDTWSNHSTLVSRDDRESMIEYKGAAILTEQGERAGLVIVFRDTSERRRVEEVRRQAQSALVRSSRVTTIGELAACIADEVSQPLSAMVSNADACLTWLHKTPPDLASARAAVSRVSRNGRQAGDAVRRAASLMRRPPVQMNLIDINSVVHIILNLVHRDLKRLKVSLEMVLAEGPVLVLGDHIQLQQVLGHLVVNGVESMMGVISRQRILRISTTVCSTGDAVVAVEDNGTGLDTATADRIFEPGFTNKVAGAGVGIGIGMGLGLGLGVGLSISRAIIDNHGGRLWQLPRQPDGCIFRFSLPKFDQNVDQT